MVRNHFSCCTIDDVTTLLAVDNKGEDVLIVEKHILLSLAVIDSFLNQEKALLIDIILVCKDKMIILDSISTLDALSVSFVTYLGC